MLLVNVVKVIAIKLKIIRTDVVRYSVHANCDKHFVILQHGIIVLFDFIYEF